MIQVVVNHYLKGFALYAVSPVLVNGLSVDSLLGHKAVAVDAASGQKLFHKFRSEGLVELLRHIAQGIFHGQFDFTFI